MELSKFVSDTLIEVMQGVVDAQTRWFATGQKGTINPVWGDYEAGPNALQQGSSDVAVTVSDTADRGAKGGIKVVGIAEMGGDVTSRRENSSVSRISFKVPIAPPIVFIKVLEGESVTDQ